VGLLLGLSAICLIATFVTSERDPNSNVGTRSRLLDIREADAAPVSVVPPAQSPKRLEVRAALPIAVLRSAPATPVRRHLSETPKRPVPPWLSELNQWRGIAGLGLVVENAELSYGSEEHARYLVVQGPADAAGFRAYDRRIGPGAHFENSHSAFYTTTGA